MDIDPTPTRRRVLVATGAGLAGAGAGAASGAARLRVLHGSPDAPAVDVLVDGTRVVRGLSFKELSPYRSVAPGDHTVEVVPAGGTAAEAVLTVDVTLEGGTDYTAAAVGPVEELRAALLAGPAPPSPGPEAAAVRVAHLAPSAPAVDVVADGTTLVSGLEFGAASDYATVSPGRYTVEVRPAESDEAVGSSTADLVAGAVYSAVAVGFVSPESRPPGFDVLVAVDASPA